MNPDGSDQRSVTNGAGGDNPTWSPDGSKIAFSSFRDTGDIEIYVMNADGTGRTRLTNNPGFDGDPAWSPNGTRIAFTRTVDGGLNDEIYAMNVDGSAQTRLTSSARISDTSPSWSPDGTRIAFRSNSDGRGEIYAMNADGSGQTRLTNNSVADFAPAWSPDGMKIAFEREGDIVVMNPNGSGETKLTNTTARESSPDWQPVRPTISVGEARVSEGTGVRRDAVFTIRLSQPVSATLSVEFTTVDGTATSGSDFVHRSGTRTFLPGETTKAVTVPIVTDNQFEMNETFTLRLLDPDPRFVTLADDEGLGLLVNDDALLRLPLLSPS